MSSLNDHTPTASDGVGLAPGLRISPEEGNDSWGQFRYIYDNVLIYQREGRFPQKQAALGSLRLWPLLWPNCTLGTGWTSGQVPCRDRAASPPLSPPHLYANGTLWPQNTEHRTSGAGICSGEHAQSQRVAPEPPRSACVCSAAEPGKVGT